MEHHRRRRLRHRNRWFCACECFCFWWACGRSCRPRQAPPFLVVTWSLDSDGREDDEGEGGSEGFREDTGSRIGEGSLSGSLRDLRKE